MTFTEPRLIDLPARTVLAVDGEGPTTSPRFAEAVRTLIAARFSLGGDYAPFEGTYRQQDRTDFDLGDPEGWVWTLSVDAPAGAADAAVPPGVRLERQPAGRAISLTHIGPYEEEGPSLAALRDFASASALTITGPHTETYLSDPTVTAPADLRTLLRYPIA